MDKVDAMVNQLCAYSHKMADHTWRWLAGLSPEEWALAMVAGVLLGFVFLTSGCGNRG